MRSRAGIPAHASLSEARSNMESTGYPRIRIHFVQGRVEQTLPRPDIGPIALLRLDTDWYESTASTTPRGSW